MKKLNYILLGIFLLTGKVSISQDDTVRNFRVVTNDGKASLSWSANEILHPVTYWIERSVDGLLYEPVKKIEGTPSHYDRLYVWVDKNPAAGNSFYRVRVADADVSFISNQHKIYINSLSLLR